MWINTFLQNSITLVLSVVVEDGISGEVHFPIYKKSLLLPDTGITAPGTKWCGPGNTATNYEDLGRERETDKCCRDHDHCEEILESHSTLHDLPTNTDMFPILKCSCEQRFLNCLQAANTRYSDTLAHVYFGSRSKCFAFGYPIMGCKQYQEDQLRVKRRCINYHVKETAEKQWQFYEMPFYTRARTLLFSENGDSV